MSSEKADGLSNGETLKMTADVVSAYVGNNVVPPGQLAGVIGAVHTTLLNLDKNGGGGDSQQTPAVPIRKSVTPGFIICLEDGKKLKMLKRHLRHDSRRIPYEMGPARGLSHGGPQLRQTAFRIRQENRPRTGLQGPQKKDLGPKPAAAPRPLDARLTMRCRPPSSSPNTP